MYLVKIKFNGREGDMPVLADNMVSALRECLKLCALINLSPEIIDINLF